MLDPLKEEEKIFLEEKYKSLGIKKKDAVRRLTFLVSAILSKCDFNLISTGNIPFTTKT